MRTALRVTLAALFIASELCMRATGCASNKETDDFGQRRACKMTRCSSQSCGDGCWCNLGARGGYSTTGECQFRNQTAS
uniref:8.4 kDa putative secretory protein n=1 Tax=Argas monolakensis TaxID=34602 RepID=Q09JR2_ARGMO|nr:8.4 kDa putative secretory protein [Argas monolakensis]